MKNKQQINERRQFMKIAGLLKEDVDVNIDDDNTPSDYNPGTPSGDTSAMNIGEAGKIPYSYSHVDDLEDAIKVVEGVEEYVKRFADTDDEGGMNEAGDLLPGLEDLKWFLIGLQKKGQNG